LIIRRRPCVASSGLASGDLSVDVLDGLATLVDTSLLRREEDADGEPRFVMLETIREYALEQLAANGEIDSLQWQHAQYYLQFAEQAECGLASTEHILWLHRLDMEQGNLRYSSCKGLL
jgi:predicted ATPase